MRSQPGEQLRQGDPEPLRNQLHIENGDIPLPPLDICEEAPVYAHPFCEYHLSPAALLAECSDSDSQAHQKVIGHDPASWPVGDQRQIVFTQQ